MSRTFSILDQVKVESFIPGEVVVDADVSFLRHNFLVFFDVVAGVGDGSLGIKLWISQSSHAGSVVGS